MLKLFRQALDYYRILTGKVIKEESRFNVPLLTKIYMNLRGFTADQYVRYDLKNNDISEYISELERWKTRKINGRYNLVMDDKLICKEVFGRYVRFPKTIAWIKNNKIYSLDGSIMSPEELFQMLNQNGAMILKPVILAGSGRGVHVFRIIEDRMYLDERLVEENYIIEFISKLNDYIAEELVIQHDYSRKLFDKTTNTIRLITAIDSDNGRASVLQAAHRIGVNESIPVDNTGKGALTAEIDLDTGILGKAKTLFDTNVYKFHPDTGALIEGIQIPRWNELKKQIIEVAERFPYIYFMAWDIVITEDSFCVIEINASTGLNMFQVWRGERNTKLGNFYKKHGIIK